MSGIQSALTGVALFGRFAPGVGLHQCPRSTEAAHRPQAKQA